MHGAAPLHLPGAAWCPQGAVWVVLPSGARQRAVGSQEREFSCSGDAIVSKLKRAFGAAVIAASVFSAPPQGSAHQTGSVVQTISGAASWYGSKFHGQPTASGEPFDMNRLTAAHRTLPFGTRIRVINEANGKAVVVRVNDRGPFAGKRVIDLSRKAAQAIGIVKRGVARVKIEVLERV